MKLIRPTVRPEDVASAMELAQSLGAEGGVMVTHPILGWDMPEFEVPDRLVQSFVAGFEEAGVTAFMLREPQ
jgi:pseudouridine-5'-phosphate glycosidase